VAGSRGQCATHAVIRTSLRSSRPHSRPSPPQGTLPYRSIRADADRTHSFGAPLSPVTLSAPPHSTSELLRTLSRVAASEPTSWLSGQDDRLSHSSGDWGTLAGGLGCFPLDDESSHPPSHFVRRFVAFAVWLGSVSALPPRPSRIPTSTNRGAHELNLNPFRGEPAISGFDWHFTPTHSSSVQFCNTERFAPPVRVTGPSHWPWVAHPVSGLLAAIRTPCGALAPYSDSLSLCVRTSTALTRPRRATRRLILQ
jgi:hypothetical protein